MIIVCVDHVHLSVAIPPKLSVSDFSSFFIIENSKFFHVIPS